MKTSSRPKLVEEEDKIIGDWTRHRAWLSDRLSDVWRDRGPFPGIGSTLQYLGCAHSTAFHHLELKECAHRRQNLRSGSCDSRWPESAAGHQVPLAEDYVGALTIAATPAFIALLRPGDHLDIATSTERDSRIQLFKQIRSELTLYEQMCSTGALYNDGAVAQNQKRPPVWAAVEERVAHNAYPRAGGVHRAPVFGAATV